MKLLQILFLLLVAFMACASAQNCRGSPRNPSCSGQRNSGRRCMRCLRTRLWYYDAGSRQCRQFVYFGMWGNNNRWCSRQICEQRCRR